MTSNIQLFVFSVKTSENDVKYSNSNMGEIDKSRELYSREGDNSSDLKENSGVGTHYMQAVEEGFTYCYVPEQAGFCNMTNTADT